MDIAMILTGIGSGVVYSLTSWGKKKDQKFETKKFITTVIVGAGAGLVMGIVNLPMPQAYDFLMTAGAVPMVENVLKIIWRKVIKPLTGKPY